MAVGHGDYNHKWGHLHDHGDSDSDSGNDNDSDSGNTLQPLIVILMLIVIGKLQPLSGWLLDHMKAEGGLTVPIHGGSNRLALMMIVNMTEIEIC